MPKTETPGGYEHLSDDELITFELRCWNALNNSPPATKKERQLRWDNVLAEIRRRQLFERLIWK